MTCTVISNTGKVEDLVVGRTYRYCHAGGCCTLVPETLPRCERIGKLLPEGVAYGRIVTAMGDDSEDADAYIGPDLTQQNVYEIRQMLPGKDGDDPSYDEAKFMFGFKSAQNAMRAYKACTWPGMYGGITQVTVAQLLDKYSSNALSQEVET